MASPWFAIFLIVLIATLAGTSVVSIWIPWLCSIFVGAISAVLFQTIASFVNTAIDTMFICVAIDSTTLSQDDMMKKAGEQQFYSIMYQKQQGMKEDCVPELGNVPPPVYQTEAPQDSAVVSPPPPPPPPPPPTMGDSGDSQ